MKFGQGYFGRTQQDDRLASDGHITCYSIVLVNLEKRDAMMFHVWEGGYNGLSPAQKDALEDFLKPLGRKVAVIAEGTESSPARWVGKELAKAGIEVLDLMHFDTGHMRWSADFDPATRRYRIEDERGKVFYDGVPLPDYAGPPKDEAGLSDAERRLHKLQRFANPRTGDLPRDAIRILDELMNRTPVSWKSESKVDGSLLYDFMESRAKAAGFSDYCEYLEADRANFVKAEPQEMVLRKIGGAAPKLRQRFKDAGRDFRKVHVTPAAVVELLKDYPRVFDRFVEKLEAERKNKKQPAAKAPRRAVI